MQKILDLLFLGLYRMDYTDLGNITSTFTSEDCQSYQEISLAFGLSGKRDGDTWCSYRWMLSTGNIHPEGKITYGKGMHHARRENKVLCLLCRMGMPVICEHHIL